MNQIGIAVANFPYVDVSDGAIFARAANIEGITEGFPTVIEPTPPPVGSNDPAADAAYPDHILFVLENYQPIPLEPTIILPIIRVEDNVRSWISLSFTRTRPENLRYLPR